MIISSLTFCLFIGICCIMIFLCCRKRKKDKKKRVIMNAIANPNQMDLQKNITPSTNDTDQAIIDGLETTGKLASVSDFNLDILHTMNRMNKERSVNKNGYGTMGKPDGEFQIDANLVSAFMFGAATNETAFNGEFGDDDKQYDDGNGYNDQNIYDEYDEDVNELAQADSTDDVNNNMIMQQRMRLMKLLQQQYELMNDYNMNPDVAMDGDEYN